MGSLSKIIKEKGGELGKARTEQIKVQQIHYTKLKESDLNFYTRSEEEVAELADTMLIAGGILQPLIVRKIDLSEYEILAGHKRRRASIYNVERGYKEYEFLPCIVIDMSGLMAKKISEKILAEQEDIENDVLLDMIAEYIVICTNSTSSESSSYEKMMQAVRLAKILPAMLENEDLKGRALRTEIAKEMKCSDGQVGRYQSIYNHLIPEAMERFQNGVMTVSVAYEMSGLDNSKQKELLKKQIITLADIELLKQEENNKLVSESDTEKEHKKELLNQEENEETVSESDTDNANQMSADSFNGDGYERIEDTKENLYLAFQLIFDDAESGFPHEVYKELINFMEEMGGHVSVMTDIFAKALPFENNYIKIKNICGYKIYFKDTHKKMGVALWPFWRAFISKYHYHEEIAVIDGLAAEKNDNFEQAVDNETESKLAAENKLTAASVEPEITNEGSTDYTLEDIKKFHNEQLEIIQQIEEYAIKCGGMIRGSRREQYKKACMIFDGLSYLLKKLEGNNRRQYEITMPCKIGDTLYSIIGDKVTPYVIAGFRIDNEKIYMETSGSMLFAADKIGTFHFFSQNLAEEKFQKMWKERRNDQNDKS